MQQVDLDVFFAYDKIHFVKSLTYDGLKFTSTIERCLSDMARDNYTDEELECMLRGLSSEEIKQLSIKIYDCIEKGNAIEN
jgi:hypothetical protein